MSDLVDDLTRRQVLRYLAYGTAGLAVGSSLVGCTDSQPSSAPRSLRGDDAGRLLVILELGGGNDGPSTVAPFDDGRYHDLRPTVALGAKQVIDLGHGYGINRRLKDVAARKPAIVFGIGTDHPDLSHFEMLDRWWHGQPEGADPKQLAAGTATGFLGRLADVLHGDERFTGVSLKFGGTPALRAKVAATTGLPPSAEGGALDEDAHVAKVLRAAVDGFSMPKGTSPVSVAATGVEQMLWVYDLLDDLPAPSKGYPDSELGLQLAVASRLARSANGIRIIHVPMAGSGFDTHAHHNALHAPLMDELNEGLDAFLQDMEEVGIAKRMLVATTSEFGRRPEEHDGGLDHGTANTMLLWGPVHGGFHGDPPSWTKLDDKDNFIATTRFDRYLATLAEWMEVEPSRVLEGVGGTPPKPIPGLLRS